MQNPNALRQLIQDVVRIYEAYRATGTNKWTYDTAARDLSYQVGSLTKYMMQLNGDRHHENKSRGEIISGISDELADILAEVLFISKELDIDLQTAWNNMLVSDQSKISQREAKADPTAHVN